MAAMNIGKRTHPGTDTTHESCRFYFP